MIEGKLAVVFGGGGFLGKHVAEQLLHAGARVRIAGRDPSDAISVKPLGRLGQTQLVAANVLHTASVAQALQGADIAINLVGTFGTEMEAIHTEGARTIAIAAANAGCSALVHVSAIGADANSPARYGRSKAAGEEAVKAAFAGATILRPSVVFGQDDQFTNRFAGLIRTLPIVPVVGASTLFQPVFVRDIALAARISAEDPGVFGGKTFELGGPQTLSMLDLNRWIATQIGRERAFVEVPAAITQLMAAATGWMPGAPITLDQFRLLGRDNIAATNALTLTDLGIDPTPMAAVAPQWLTPFRKHGRFGAATA